MTQHSRGTEGEDTVSLRDLGLGLEVAEHGVPVELRQSVRFDTDTVSRAQQGLCSCLF
jgi:hypothetical protein